MLVLNHPIKYAIRRFMCRYFDHNWGKPLRGLTIKYTTITCSRCLLTKWS